MSEWALMRRPPETRREIAPHRFDRSVPAAWIDRFD
jgi:hypothetical protein